MVKVSRAGLYALFSPHSKAAPSLACGQTGSKAASFSQRVLATLKMEGPLSTSVCPGTDYLGLGIFWSPGAEILPG